MSDTDRTGALKRKVEDTVGGDERFSQTFAPYWGLFEAATEGMKIRSFYIRVVVERPFLSSQSASISACDVAAVCDGLLVNLKADDKWAVGTSTTIPERTLTVKPLTAIGAVNLHPSGVEKLRDTQNALLTVTTDDASLYWFAKTEDEWGYLVDFAQDLIRAIAAR